MKRDAEFLVGQKAFIEKDGNVLVLNDPVEGLDFPGGKIQEGEAQDGNAESLIRALEREVTEETALKIKVGHPFHVWYHEFPKGNKNYPKTVYLVGFQCKYVSGEITLSNEHDNYKWVNKNNFHEVDDGSDFFDALKNYFDLFTDKEDF